MLATVPASAGFGVAELQLDIDEAEHERRRAAGLGVATGYGFGGLNVLMALPHGLPVPLATLSDHQRAYVSRVPAGICTVTDGQVVRHVTRPCRVRLATVRTVSASQLALEATEKFTTFCARQVIISSAPSVHYPEKLLEFGLYGIGVCLQHPDGELETLVEPRPWRVKRHSPEAWWFAETAYSQFLTQQSSPAPTPSPALDPVVGICPMPASTASRRAYRGGTTCWEEQPMSAQPDHAPVTPYAPAPGAPAELLAQLRADRRADRWVPAFQQEWTAALEESRRTFSLAGLYEVVQVWQARVASAPAVDAFLASGKDDSEFADLEEIRRRRR